MPDIELKKENEFRWKISATGKMRTDGIIYANDHLIKIIEKDASPNQVANVATLPGIVGPSMAMPDIHWGYGFPIGGVAAFDESKGIVSPGGVGYDINCGVRMIATNLDIEEIKEHIPEIISELYEDIPSGVGSKSKFLDLDEKSLNRVLIEGASKVIEMGYGREEDIEFIESNGVLPGAKPDAVSARARERGEGQLGTLGSGNHFLEIDTVEEIYNNEAASAMNLRTGTIVISIHTGSRGLGHQICDDALKMMQQASKKYGIELPDRQLSCAPLGSKEAETYLAGMSAAANFAFANRQVITHLVRKTMIKFFKKLGIQYDDRIIYDVAHNIAKWEKHTFEGKERKLLVHRKGATRAFPPGHPELPNAYKKIGQPVLIPGDMGRSSFILVGTQKAMETTFGSTCHGAGRVLSRQKAKSIARASEVVKNLENQGIIIRAASKETIVEEISEAYKDVSEVVEVVKSAGIALPVAKLKPLGVIKG